MTDEELLQQIDPAVRETIAAHPGANAEAIADILAGPQTRDPRQVEAGVREVIAVVINDLGATNDDDDTVEEVALATERDLGLAEISAMAWLCVCQRATELLGQAS